ncbi:MAG: VWA domain-containing protein [Deltaproteobacteria bacterium]|jgi:uncharacterized protein YegL|nr:VWA domain-containing protein [Deltaproteobacteria bacterium]
MHRRLPVYLVLDISESMIGEPITILQNGVAHLIKTLKKNPYALESMFVSIITFASKATVISPLTELTQFTCPPLSVRPGTSLGAALSLVKKQIEKEVVKNTPTSKGDFKPLVFILTDGEPTDNWKEPLAGLQGTKPVPNIIAVGCGEEVDFGVLVQISETAINISDITEDTIYKFFTWMSTSVGRHSEALTENKPEISLLKTKLPGGISLVKASDVPKKKAPPKVFLTATCSRTKKKYALIYRYQPVTEMYLAFRAYPLPEDFPMDEAFKAPSVEMSKLVGTPHCPFCGAELWYHCGVCDNLICLKLDELDKSVTCPICQNSSKLGGGGSGINLKGTIG